MAPHPSSYREEDREGRPNGRAEPASEDGLFKALEAVFTEELGKPEARSEYGRRRKAVKELVEIGATPQELSERIAEYRDRWPEIELTETGITGNWSLLGRERPRRGLSAREIMAQAPESVKAESWMRKTGWQLYPDDARHFLEDRFDLADGEIEVLLQLHSKLRSEEERQGA